MSSGNGLNCIAPLEKWDFQLRNEIPLNTFPLTDFFSPTMVKANEKHDESCYNNMVSSLAIIFSLQVTYSEDHFKHCKCTLNYRHKHYVTATARDIYQGGVNTCGFWVIITGELDYNWAGFLYTSQCKITDFLIGEIILVP